MSNKSNQLENFKGATAATLRAIAGKKNFDVKFNAQERIDRPTTPQEEGTSLPLPDQDMDAANQTLMRGAADAKALRLQHHAPNIHQQNAPMDLTARAVFEALEQARCEAIGANQMPGVKDNLNKTLSEKCDRLGYTRLQSREDSNIADAIHAYARVTLTGEEPPESATALLKQWKPWIEKKLGQGKDRQKFEDLKPLLDDQGAYARLSRNLMQSLDLIATDAADDASPTEAPAEGDTTPEELEQSDEQTSEQEQDGSQAIDSTDDNESAGEADETDMEDVGEDQISGESEDQDAGNPDMRRPESLPF